VNDPRGAAGHSRGEVVLFDEERALSCPRAFARYGDSIDATADDHYLKVLPFQGWSRFNF
jgi:hypothetical protein